MRVQLGKMGRMVPMGFELQLSPLEQAVILAILLVVGLAAAVPASLPLALVGAGRAQYHPGWNGFWYWLWGTVLTLGTAYALFRAGLDWWGIPVGWLPGWGLALLLRRRPRGLDQQSAVRV